MSIKRRWVIFEGARGPDQQEVRAGVWDRVCVPGQDEKDGQHTEFTLETLSEMADNFLERGDVIPLDFNHQSNYSHINGQPAPALAFYGALAVVMGGQVVKLVRVGDTPPCPGSLYVSPMSATPDGIDLSRDGLWAFRCEVTELGQQLLRNFKYVSPTFLSEGTKRDGTPIGYCLAAVAATNTPWQGETQVTFDGDVTATPSGQPSAAVSMRIEQRDGEYVVLPENGDRVLGKHKTRADAEKQLAAIEASKHKQEGSTAGTAPAQPGQEAKMAKFQKFAKFAGAAEGADDAAIMDGLGAKLGKLAQEAMEDEAFKHEEEAAKLEDMAKAFDGDEDEKAKEMGRKLSKMAASFRRFAKLSKFDADGDDDGDKAKKMEEEKAKMAKLEADKDKGVEAKMAVMQATLEAQSQRLAKFERVEAERAAAATAEKEKQFSALADAAIAGGYPKAKREQLINFARSDFSSAHSLVESFLPKTGAPAHLFDRLSNQGAPVGTGRQTREFEAASPKKRVFRSPLGNFVEDDAAFAERSRQLAESKDPTEMAKVDRYIADPSKRAVMFDRILAAQRIVRAEHPDLDPDTAEAAGE